MTLKDTLKRFKLNESTISMLLGALVIIVVGVAAVNFLGNQEAGNTIPAIESEDLSEQSDGKLPATHTVQEGEDLWNISEQYYDTGYNWTLIAEANNITDPDQLNAGDEITIPAADQEAAVIEVSPTPDTLAQADEEVPTATIAPTASAEPTQEPTDVPSERDESDDTLTESDENIGGETYTVVRGDTLWEIAERAYGDPYRWVDIADANDLVNPNLIHPGNTFTIPR